MVTYSTASDVTWINYQYDFFTKLAQAKFLAINAILCKHCKLYKRIKVV